MSQPFGAGAHRAIPGCNDCPAWSSLATNYGGRGERELLQQQIVEAAGGDVTVQDAEGCVLTPCVQSCQRGEVPGRQVPYDQQAAVDISARLHCTAAHLESRLMCADVVQCCLAKVPACTLLELSAAALQDVGLASAYCSSKLWFQEHRLTLRCCSHLVLHRVSWMPVWPADVFWLPRVVCRHAQMWGTVHIVSDGWVEASTQRRDPCTRVFQATTPSRVRMLLAGCPAAAAGGGGGGGGGGGD